jgi:antirestriction protein
MHQIAGIHHVRLPVIGDWLDAEGYTGHDLDPGTLLHDFAAAYAGPYPSELAYSCHRMDHLGWTQTLQHAGIPDRYLDRAAINRDWFHDHVRAIPNTTTGIEVFRRRR